MNILNLIIKAEYLLKEARAQLAHENIFHAELYLVKLRKLLNDQPELEEGGAQQKPNRKEVKK